MHPTAANGGSLAQPHEIDEDLHSRQLAVYGRESMRRMAAANVLICGAGGLGAEIGKPSCCVSFSAFATVILRIHSADSAVRLQPRTWFWRV